jgi:hypothetical protein
MRQNKMAEKEAPSTPVSPYAFGIHFFYYKNVRLKIAETSMKLKKACDSPLVPSLLLCSHVELPSGCNNFGLRRVL